MALTPEQLRSLPTILIQCQAFSIDTDPSVDDYDSIPGYTGSLDPSSPRDLLIAIPATSYMDYNAATNEYMSRLYFTETMGGVLGSNTMQGHNVLFDWQNGRIGFAESSCTYDKREVPDVAEDPGFPTDCEVGDPLLTEPCIETVDKRVCKYNYHGIKIIGNETWTAVVRSPGNEAGVSCSAAAKSTNGDEAGSENIFCGGEGVCTERRSCELTCAEADEALKIAPVLAVPRGRRKSSLCGDSGWSACDYNCMQTRVVSKAFSDGNCHEQSRERRACHIGACAHADPCKVPFLVHVVMVFRGGSAAMWSEDADEAVALALEQAFAFHAGEKFFTAGDVHVAMALPWYQDPDEMEIALGPFDGSSVDLTTKLGLRVIVEISMFNSRAVSTKKNSSSTYFEAFANLTDRIRSHRHQCTREDLFPLARKASKTKLVLEDPDFFRQFVKELQRLDNKWLEPFGPLLADESNNVTGSRVLTVWTIPTRVDDEVNFHGPRRPFINRMLSLLQFFLILSASPFVMVSFVNALNVAHEFILAFRRHGRRALGRAQHNNPNPNDVESSIIIGTENLHITYKVTRPSRRARSFVPAK